LPLRRSFNACLEVKEGRGRAAGSFGWLRRDVCCSHRYGGKALTWRCSKASRRALFHSRATAPLPKQHVLSQQKHPAAGVAAGEALPAKL